MAVLHRECTPATNGAVKCWRHKVGKSPCEAACTLRFFHIKLQLVTPTSPRSRGRAPGITRATAPSGYAYYGSLHFPGKKANIQRLAGESRLAWRCPSLAGWPSLDRLK